MKHAVNWDPHKRRLKLPFKGPSCSVSNSDFGLVSHFLTPSCFSARLGHLALVPPFCVTCFCNFFLWLPVHSSSLSSLMPSYQGQDKHTFYAIKHDLCITLVILPWFPNHVRWEKTRMSMASRITSNFRDERNFEIFKLTCVSLFCVWQMYIRHSVYVVWVRGNM